MISNTQTSTRTWPVIAQDEIDAATTVLRSGNINYWTGQEGRLFEQEFARMMACDHAVALANGTVALELALHALDLEPGDHVIVTPRTFIASASAVVTRGLIPIFADVDRDSGNITADTVAAALTPRTRAIITVHLAGWPCEMDAVAELAAQKNLYVIEDCAQSHGATYRGRPVGSLGHAAAWSFCQDKIMTTGGEGGMLTTNDETVWAKAWSYKDHGKDYELAMQPNPSREFRWLHRTFGSNWRLTEMQAAIGRVQLWKLPMWSEKRRQLAGILTEGFSEMPGLRVTIPPTHLQHAYYKYYTYVRPERLRYGWNRDRISTELRTQRVNCFAGTGSCSEIYREDAFANVNMQPTQRLPMAAELGNSSLMFLVHPTLEADDMHEVLQRVRDIMARATK